MFRKKKAQSTLEYIIVFVVIVTAVLVLAYNALTPGVKSVLKQSADQMTSHADNDFKLKPEKQ